MCFEGTDKIGNHFLFSVYIGATLIFAQIYPAYAAPKIETAYNFYSVSGTTVGAIGKSMKEMSPFDSIGRTQTKEYKWRKWWDKGASTCKLFRLRVSTKIKYTLPRHKNKKALPPNLRRKWETYISKLTKHEHNHGKIIIEGAVELEKKLAGLNPRSSCTKLTIEAKRLAAEAYKEMDRRNKAYDRRTRNGASEGIVWPRN